MWRVSMKKVHTDIREQKVKFQNVFWIYKISYIYLFLFHNRPCYLETLKSFKWYLLGKHFP